MSVTNHRLIGTIFALCAGGLATVLGAGGVNAVLLTLLIEVVVLQLTAEEQRDHEHKRLVASVGLATALVDSDEHRNLLSGLATDLAHVRSEGYALFSRRATDDLVTFADRIKRLGDGQLVIEDPNEIQMEGIWLLEHLSSELFATSVVSLETFWIESRGPDYHRKNLDVQRRGGSITRVFILDSDEALHDPRLRTVLDEQAAANVDVRYVQAQRLPDSAVLDFGIWDDSMVCTLVPAADDPSEIGRAEYDTTTAGLQRARAVRDLILHEAHPLSRDATADGSHGRTSEELILRESAPLMSEEALDHCVGGYVDGDGCCWYHEAWQYLKAYRLVETPTTHGDFFEKYIHQVVATTDEPRILVCGLADYEMCAVVLRALEDRPRGSYRLTVLDVCNTPLRNTEWFATRQKVHVVTRRADARDTNLPAESFDLVVTDAFLTKLPPEESAQVVAEWRRVLAPGGQVVTTVKLGYDGGRGVRATDTQVEHFTSRAFQAYSDVSTRMNLSDDEFATLARRYAERNVSYPINGDEELTALFEGFDVAICGTVPVSEYALTYYAQVTAVRINDP